MLAFGKILIKRRIVVNAVYVALVVGILLNMTNQGILVINGLDIAWVSVVMNFAVPYCVASYSAAKKRNRAE